MKAQNSSGKSSIFQESGRRRWWEKFRPDDGGRPMNSISREIERRNKRRGIEDPIRTIMFLSSWSHT